ncbi:hypothetical protein SAY86_009074 [Trapa natans]|uniref:Annexin n=1 Tax=Trapa natans TaxID=22666 RepID=A0AAN7QBS3_TRANT|nr:hypothetical protein SAY86_009074 [Trapa natans]
MPLISSRMTLTSLGIVDNLVIVELGPKVGFHERGKEEELRAGIVIVAGWGTDEKAVISILGYRNLSQRRLIREAYREIYREDLFSELQSEFSGHLEKALTHWILDPVDHVALLVHSELRKLNPNHGVIAEIACIRSPEDLLAVKRAYRSRYRRSMEEDVASLTSGNARKILVALASPFRYDGDEISEQTAVWEASILHEEIHGIDRNLEETVRILSTRSKAQLNATFNHYRDIYNTSITKGLKGDSILKTAIRCIKDPMKYQAKARVIMIDVFIHLQVLRRAITNVGTDQEVLSRVVISSAEKDLKHIKEAFLERNNVSLEEAVAGGTSGDYRDFILALLGSDDLLL